MKIRKCMQGAACLLIGMSAVMAAQGQASVDLQTTLVTPEADASIAVGAPFRITVFFKNNGPDILQASDTVFVQIEAGGERLANLYRTNSQMNVNDSIGFTTQPLAFSASPEGPVDFCVIGLPAGNMVTDPVMANNKSCHTITITGGSNGVRRLSEEHIYLNKKLILSPNPASVASGIILSYDVEQAGPVTLSVLGMTGREVLRNTLGIVPAGRLQVYEDLSMLAPGMYVISFQGQGEYVTEKLIIR